MNVREFRREDREAVLAVYQRSVEDLYPVFETPKVLVDPSAYSWFRPAGLMVAVEGDDRIVGFGLGKLNAENTDAFLMGLFVDPGQRGRGVGSQLLAAVERWVGANGKTVVRIRPCGEGYFTLGVADDSRFLPFFTGRGFREDPDLGYHPLWMKFDARAWAMPAAVQDILDNLTGEDITVRISDPNDGARILSLTERCFPGWHESHMIPNFRDPHPAPVAVAVKGDRAVAFTGPLYVDTRGVGTLGAVGVDPEFRRKGLARAVFNRACQYWKETGARDCHLWTGTGNPAVKVYEEAGMRIHKTYLGLVKELSA